MTGRDRFRAAFAFGEADRVPLFEEAGCRGYGEIDREAGMDLGELRQRFPRLVLLGGVPCGTVLHHGTPEEVRACARRAVADAHRGGGLILGSAHESRW